MENGARGGRVKGCGNDEREKVDGRSGIDSSIWAIDTSKSGVKSAG